MPNGVQEEDLGKCHHAIHIADAEFEIGILKRGKQYILLWDSWIGGGLQKAIGKNGEKLKQAYAIARIHKEARLKGYRVTRKRVDNGIRLVMTV